MTHRVKKGDTLSAIAKKYNTTVAEIMRVNSAVIQDPNKIQVGWDIKIPSPSTGDSFQQAFHKVLKDIEDLPSFKKFMEML